MGNHDRGHPLPSICPSPCWTTTSGASPWRSPSWPAA